MGKQISFFVWIKCVRLWMCHFQKKQTQRKRLRLAEFAGNRVMKAPYNMIFPMMDRELTDLDLEIADINEATNMDEFLLLRSANFASNKDEMVELISEADLFLLGLKNPDVEPEDLAGAINFLEENK